MNVSEIMNPLIGTVQSQNTISQAAAEMERQRVKALVVTVGQKPHGIVTERDIAGRLSRENGNFDPARQVREVMTEEVAACYEDTDVRKLPGFINQNGIRRLLIVNRQWQTVGYVLAEEIEASGAKLEKLTRGGRAKH